MTNRTPLALLALALTASPAAAELTFYEPFDYTPDGADLSGNVNTLYNRTWTRSGTGANDPKLTTGNLSYPNLPPSSGNSVLLNNTLAGQTASRVEIGSYGENTTLYYSLIMQVTDLTGLTNTTTGSFFTGLNYQYPEATAAADGLGSGSQSSMGTLNIHFDQDDNAYNLGIAVRDAPAATTRVFDTTPYTTADKLFVVVKYVIGPGNQDDEAYLYVNPDASTFGQSEPATYTVRSATPAGGTFYDYFYYNSPTVVNGVPKAAGDRIVDSSGNELTAIRSLILRNNSVEPAHIQIDELRVGTTWADVTAATPPPTLVGDTNNDGVVDLADLNNVLNNFGDTGVSPGDDNGDGVVDLTDLNNVLNNFGDTAAASALSVVPEPASAAYLFAGSALLNLRRRRHPRPVCP